MKERREGVEENGSSMGPSVSGIVVVVSSARWVNHVSDEVEGGITEIEKEVGLRR